MSKFRMPIVFSLALSPLFCGCGSDHLAQKNSNIKGLDTSSLAANESQFVSLRPSDYGSFFRIGDGYDALSGERKSSCLDTDKTSIRSYPINRVDDTLELVSSHADLAKKLGVEVNAEASAVIDVFSGSASVKTNIIRETTLSSSSIVAIAEYRYLKDEITVYDSLPAFSAAKSALLTQDKTEFRRQCGDKFTRSINTGATLLLVFKAEKMVQSNYDLNQVQTAIKLGFSHFFGLGTSITLTDEQKQILANFRISTRCYSEGTSAHICADHELNISSVAFDDNTVLANIKAAKMALANDIDSGKNIVALSEVLEPFQVPYEMGKKNPYEVYVDYRDYLTKIQTWLQTEESVVSLCNSINFYKEQCDGARKQIASGIESCAFQRNWSTSECRMPRSGEFNQVLAANDAGQVTLYEHGGARGRKLLLDFSNLYTNYATLQPNVLYSLHTDQFNHFENIFSSFNSSLVAGWQLVIYEHPDGTGYRFVVNAGTPYGDAGWWFNDRASSFRLMRIAE